MLAENTAHSVFNVHFIRKYANFILLLYFAFLRMSILKLTFLRNFLFTNESFGSKIQLKKNHKTRKRQSRSKQPAIPIEMENVL